RREALELALYTFRYLDNTDSVVAFFPPKDLAYVMYFTKGDLADQLHAPLRRTLAQTTRPLARTLSESERAVVDNLTIGHQYRWRLRVEGEDANALLLAPP